MLEELFLTQELHKSQVEMQHILETTTDLMFKYDPENGAVLLHKAEEEDYHQFFSEKDMLKRLAAEGYLEESYVATLEECLEHVRDGEHRLSCIIEAIMERFNDQINEARKEFPFLSISGGVFITNRRHTYEQYYGEADKALYETKKNGKSNYTGVHPPWGLAEKKRF